MRALLYITLFLLLFSSCIPTKIAPDIKGEKVMVAKKFKKQLPKINGFIFEDPKNANEFYKYINTRFQKNNVDVRWNVPFTIDNEKYYLSFYEVERTSNTINLAPMIIDAALENNDIVPILEDSYTSRSGKWYLVLTVDDENFYDCLKENYPKRETVVAYLKQLKKHYLSTNNYDSLLFGK